MRDKATSTPTHIYPETHTHIHTHPREKSRVKHHETNRQTGRARGGGGGGGERSGERVITPLLPFLCLCVCLCYSHFSVLPLSRRRHNCIRRPSHRRPRRLSRRRSCLLLLPRLWCLSHTLRREPGRQCPPPALLPSRQPLCLGEFRTWVCSYQGTRA